MFAYKMHMASRRFNPGSGTGSDSYKISGSRRHARFNPRSRAESDPTMIAKPTAKTGFNPRSRAGSDAMSIKRSYSEMVSIHAPARGAT